MFDQHAPCCERDMGTGNASPVTWIFAIVCFREDRWLTFFAPNLVPGLSRMKAVMLVPFIEISIDGRLRLVQTLIVAVVDDPASHTTEDRFDHVEELGARG